jgi:DNA (cytosine-5)-methyltransferase 1
MLAASLIGMEGWYSSKCKLTWKLRAMNRKRMYFQLVPLTLRTEGIGFGLLLWTVTNTSLQRERSGADEQRENETGGQQLERTEQRCHGNDNGFSGIVADTKEWRLPERDAEQTQHGTYAAAERYDGIPGWRDFPTQSAVCRRDDGIPDRVDRIKALGNAIVPQVAYQIFKAIEATTQTKKAPVPGAI